MTMGRFVLVAVTCAGCAAGASAEVIVGAYSQPMFQDGFIQGTPVHFMFQYWHHGGRQYTDLSIYNVDYSHSGAALLALSPNDDDRTFFEGQFVSTTGPADDSYRWGSSEDIDGKFYYRDFAGEIGEMVYIGFAFDRAGVAPGERLRNAGFLQLQKVGPASYESIGFAYETDADAEIRVFNLVPAPAAATAFLFSGVFAARRRR